MRLDAVLAFALPGLGVRGRRRLWEWCRVTVNGRNRQPGFFVAQGDVVRLEPVSEMPGCGTGEGVGREDPFREEPFREDLFREERVDASGACGPVLRLVAMNADFIAVHKPCGLHSAHVAGGRGASLESLLARQWGRLWREWGGPPEIPAGPPDIPGGPPALPAGSPALPDGPPPALPLLLTRLDEATSGIVLAARSKEAAERFRLAEKRGLVEKCYFAVLRGTLRHPLVIRNKLVTANRKITLVLDEEDPDTTRHTLVTPLNRVDIAPAGGDGEDAGEGGATLVQVRIKRGARHQIRAHLAGAGFPLAGEWLYPSPVTRETGARLYLHHAGVDFPGFSARDMPHWNLGER